MAIEPGEAQIKRFTIRRRAEKSRSPLELEMFVFIEMARRKRSMPLTPPLHLPRASRAQRFAPQGQTVTLVSQRCHPAQVAPFLEHFYQMARAVDEAIMPFMTRDGNFAGDTVFEKHQWKQVEGTCGAAIDKDDASIANHLQAIVIGVIL